MPVTPPRLDEFCIGLLSNLASTNHLDALPRAPSLSLCTRLRKLLPLGSRCCKPHHLLRITCIFCADVTAESRLRSADPGISSASPSVKQTPPFRHPCRFDAAPPSS